MKKVAIYARVSTTIQAEEGYSISEQTDKLSKYCEIMGWAVYNTYTDAGFTGSNIERPAMQQLIKDAKESKFDTVLVYKLDRLSRSQKDTLFLIEDVFNKIGIGFVSLQEKFDTTTPFGKAMIGILSVFAQLEREQIKERMALGYAGRIKSGKTAAHSIQPFGYDYNKEKGTLSANSLQANIVKRIFEMYLDGISIVKIVRILNDEGHIGKEKLWAPTTVRRTLANPVYIGSQLFKGELYKTENEVIIDESTYWAVQDELAKRNKKVKEANNNPKPFQSKYMLSGILKCGKCGKPLIIVVGNKKKDGTTNNRYQCYYRKTGGGSRPVDFNENNACDSGYFRQDALEKYVIDSISELQINDQLLETAVSTTEDSNKVDTMSLKKELDRLEKELAKYKNMYMIDAISLEELQEQTKQNTLRKKSIINQLNQDKTEVNNLRISRAKKLLSSKNISELPYGEQKIMVNTIINKIICTNAEYSIIWNF